MQKSKVLHHAQRRKAVGRQSPNFGHSGFIARQPEPTVCSLRRSVGVRLTRQETHPKR
jgi:hypothetical protein